MNYIFGFAGISQEILPDILRDQISICGSGCTVISRPLQKQTYSLSDTNYYLGKFSELLEKDHHNKLSDAGFALIYIARDSQSTKRLSDSFFPAVLTVAIDWTLDTRSKKTIQESKNQLILKLRNVVGDIKLALPALKKELIDKANKTPLLLPIKNFDSSILKLSLNELQEKLITDANKLASINAAIQKIANAHPQQRLTGKPAYFVDDRRVEFHAPGHSQHGFSRISDHHPIQCFLAGRRRLGAPYPRAFHYDCIKGAGNLKGLFWGCHEAQAMREGAPHLNISPNDHVR